MDDDDEFVRFLQGPVRSRLRDEDMRARFEADLRAIATTDMSDVVLRRLLSSEPAREDWEIGESIAECVLELEGATWPSNTERDKRTPKASLPGADLVGFFGTGQDVRLALGEVKTSGAKEAPPNVMYGRSGMVHQLDALANRIEVHLSIIYWLHARCVATSHWRDFRIAVRHYLNSGGREIVLLGVLMRDTTPDELDLKNRASALSSSVSSPTNVTLTAWYLPRPISAWVSTVDEAEAA